MNPCLQCGACCAFYRVSFYWRAASDVTPEGVPVELTDNLTPFRRVMNGTDQSSPRCIALEGEIGRGVRCTIYERRPAMCRGFRASYSDGTPQVDCDRARTNHGLSPLRPEGPAGGARPAI